MGSHKSFRLGKGCSCYLIRGSWRIQFRDSDKNPARKTLSLRTRSREEAAARAYPLYHQWVAGGYDPWQEAAVKVTLKEARDRYLNEIEQLVSHGERSPNTLRTARQRTRKLIKALSPSVRLDEIPLDTVKRILRSGEKGQTLARATQRSLYVGLHAFAGWCVESGLTRKRFTDGIEKPREPEAPLVYMTPDQFERLLTAIQVRYEEAKAQGVTSDRRARHSRVWLRPVVLLAANTGLRRGELSALTWGDVSEGWRNGEGWVTVRATRTGTIHHKPKWDSAGSVPLSSGAMQALEEAHERRSLDEGVQDDPVLKGASGGPFSPDMATREFRAACDLAGLPSEFTFHTLRHTFASWLVQAGVEIATVSKLMRHRTLSTTMRYAHLAPETLSSAVERLPIGPKKPASVASSVNRPAVDLPHSLSPIDLQ